MPNVLFYQRFAVNGPLAGDICHGSSPIATPPSFMSLGALERLSLLAKR